MAANDRPSLITAEDAAAWLGWTTEYVRRLARQGKIPAVKAGPHSWRFYPNELQDWLAEGRPLSAQERLPLGGHR